MQGMYTHMKDADTLTETHVPVQCDTQIGHALLTFGNIRAHVGASKQKTSERNTTDSIPDNYCAIQSTLEKWESSNFNLTLL